MRPRIPSPATALAGLALFVSLGGTSLAAVSFARNAGAVDGKSAVGGAASLKHSAKKLIAAGSDGRLAGRFVAGVGHTTTFGSYVQVTDNATGASSSLADYTPVGTLTASCTDENTATAIKDPATLLSFTNSSGQVINYAARLGTGTPTIVGMQPSTVQTITVRGSNTFEINASYRDTNVRIDGTVRQDGRGTADANCLVYGTLTVVS